VRARARRAVRPLGFLATTAAPTKAPATRDRKAVGGFRLAISCLGTGSPTVVFERGAGRGGKRRGLLQPRVAKTTRVCSRPRRARGQRRSPTSDRYRCESSRSCTACWRGPHLLPTSGGWSPGFLQSLVREAVSGRGVGSSGWTERRSGFPAMLLNPPGPALDLIGGRLPIPTTWRPPARSRRAGPGSASARPPDARKRPAWCSRRLRGAVVEVAEAGRPPVDVVDPRRAENAGHGIS
jgi:hypothetical protein